MAQKIADFIGWELSSGSSMRTIDNYCYQTAMVIYVIMVMAMLLSFTFIIFRLFKR